MFASGRAKSGGTQTPSQACDTGCIYYVSSVFQVPGTAMQHGLCFTWLLRPCLSIETIEKIVACAQTRTINLSLQPLLWQS